ncbi:MAG: hypothetical protein NT075_11180 [Chloroflexi bacterium]|nr:hypothetical protein [Chloroflexota bacterium]
MRWNWEKDWIVPGAMFGIACFMAIVATICYGLGLWIPVEDAHITALGVCLNNTAYAPVPLLSTDTQKFYWCGIVEGTTYGTGTLYLFYEDKVVFQQSLKVELGHFFLPVLTKEFDVYKPGHYRVEIRAEKQTIAETEFTVTAAKSLSEELLNP